MHKKLDPKEIAALRAAGFYVAPVAGQSEERYTWANKSGARQKDTQQPPRRSEDQAWYDCNEYATDGDPGPARPDWLES
jgi:hypothetical protein